VSAWRVGWIAFLIGMVFFLFPPAPASADAPLPINFTLRQLATFSGLPHLGSTDGDFNSPLYRNTIPREFNSISPEAVFKFEFTHPCPPPWLIDTVQFPETFNESVYDWVVQQGTARSDPAYHCFVENPAAHEWEWGAADSRIAFAEANNLQVFAHTLLWHVANPTWLTDPAVTLSPAERERIMEEHIRGVVRHVGASPAVYGFDVVNEAILPDGSLLPLSPWLSVPNYIHKAFVIARDELDQMGRTDITLFYNDYEIEYGHERYHDVFVATPGCYRKSDAVYEVIRQLVEEQGTPIDGVGFQSHLVVTGEPLATCENGTNALLHNTGRMVTMMRRFGALGLEVRVTEIDVTRRGDALNDEQLSQLQSAYFGGAMAACLATRGICTGYTVWGTHDGASWYNGRPGFPAPNPLIYELSSLRVYDPDTETCISAPRRLTNERYCPKVGYEAIRAVLEREMRKGK
jgi:GH35 family endo-1,4-beta-xylanase